MVRLLFVLVNLVRGWWIGILSPESLITFAFVGICCALGGVLALTGDGDVILFTGADEGQRDAIREAVMPAFSLAFWGMFLIWISYSVWPAWRASPICISAFCCCLWWSSSWAATSGAAAFNSIRQSALKASHQTTEMPNAPATPAFALR